MLHSDEIILRKIIKEVDFSVERLKGESFEEIKLEDLFATVKEDFPSLKDKLTSLLVQKK